MKYVNQTMDIPLCAVSMKSSLENKTGSWRFARPVFVDRVPPCNGQCPAGEDIAGVLYLAAQERFEDAWRSIMMENPFPSVMGRVCYHTCETRCNRGEHDEAVSIHAIERFLGDYALERGLRVPPGPDREGGIAAVVGAGPAGLSAAYHLRRLGHRVVVYDANDRPGGLMRYGIPAYRLPRDVLDGEIRRLEEMGIRFEMGRALGRDLALESLAAEFDAVFIGTGAHRETVLGIRGERSEGVFQALAFLEEVSRGGTPAIGRRVAIIGGGNSAVDCARTCRRLGADVRVLYRRGEADMPAHVEEVAAAREEGVSFEFLCAPAELPGDGKAGGLILERMRLGQPDESGRRRPEPTGERFDMPCDSVILAVGESPDLEVLPEALREGADIAVSDDFGRTAEDRFFVGGDLSGPLRTVTHAIGSGKRAAAAMDDFLRGRGPTEKRRFRWGDTGNIAMGALDDFHLFPRRNPDRSVVSYADLNPFYFDRRAGMPVRELPVEERTAGFDEVALGPTRNEVLFESRRCFNCGSCTECGNCFIFCPDLAIRRDPCGFGYVVDLDYCKGCGICVHECPRGAMTISFAE